MGISGFSGAYLTEKAEREREMKQLGKAMLNRMDNTIQAKAGSFASIVTSIVDGLSPALAGSVVIFPYLLTLLGWIDMETAFVLSIVFTFTSLFLLGVFLAKVSKTSWLIYGLKMLLVGGLVTAATFILGKVLGFSAVG